MNRIARALAVTAFLAAAPLFSQSFGKTTTLQMPEGQAVTGSISVDVDRDGLTDLVIPTHVKGKKFARTARIYLRHAGAAPFRAEPDFVVEFPADVCAFAVGDVHADPGWEIVMITSQTAYAWRPKAADADRVVKLAPVSFLWQAPGPENTLPWMSATDDLNGDGLEDLFIPEPTGYRVVHQLRKDGVASFGTPNFIRFPADDSLVATADLGVVRGSSGGRLSIRLSDSEADEGPLVEIEESTPALIRADVDGDGDIDLLGQSAERLYVWTQSPGQGFTEKPAFTWDLPVIADQRRRLDVSYVSLLEDLDGDKKADNVIVAGDQRSSEVRTQILVFVQGKPGPGTTFDAASPLYGKSGVPAQLLVIAGFAGDPALDDIDNDGLPDLIVGSLRVDTLDALRAAGSDAIDADVYVYKNRGGTFSPRPDLSWRVALKVEGLRRGRRDLQAKFVGDVTGDGIAELLVRDTPEHAALYMVRRQKDALAVIEKPLWETTVSSGARILREWSGPKGATEFVVLEGTQLFHVRFQ